MTSASAARCGAWGALGHAGALGTLCGDLAANMVDCAESYRALQAACKGAKGKGESRRRR